MGKGMKKAGVLATEDRMRNRVCFFTGFDWGGYEVIAFVRKAIVKQ